MSELDHSNGSLLGSSGSTGRYFCSSVPCPPGRGG